MPQPAIAQPGSCGCTAAEQELANDTLPSFSAGSAATADVARTDKATAKTVRAAGYDMAALLPDWWPVAHGAECRASAFGAIKPELGPAITRHRGCPAA